MSIVSTIFAPTKSVVMGPVVRLLQLMLRAGPSILETLLKVEALIFCTFIFEVTMLLTLLNVVALRFCTVKFEVMLVPFKRRDEALMEPATSNSYIGLDLYNPTLLEDR